MFKDIDPIDFGFILFCIFVGSGVSFVFNKDTENRGIVRLLYIQFASFFFVGICALIAVNRLKWPIEYIAATGFLLGIGGQKFLHLAWQAYEENKSILEFVQLLGKAVTAFYKVIVTVQKGPVDKEDEPEAPPTT